MPLAQGNKWCNWMDLDKTEKIDSALSNAFSGHSFYSIIESGMMESEAFIFWQVTDPCRILSPSVERIPVCQQHSRWTFFLFNKVEWDGHSFHELTWECSVQFAFPISTLVYNQYCSLIQAPILLTFGYALTCQDQMQPEEANCIYYENENYYY